MFQGQYLRTWFLPSLYDGFIKQKKRRFTLDMTHQVFDQVLRSLRNALTDMPPN
jgi:hypothetical protein